MIRRDGGILMAIAIIIFAGVIFIDTNFLHKEVWKAKPSDSMMMPAPSSAQVQPVVPKKAISFRDINIGVPREVVKTILDATAYEIQSEPFGQLNSDARIYSASPVYWWGLEGRLDIEFSERTGKSTSVTWSVPNVTLSDYKILVKEISDDMPKASNSSGVNSGYYAHTWKTKGKSYDLLWYEITGRIEFKMPAEAIYYPD